MSEPIKRWDHLWLGPFFGSTEERAKAELARSRDREGLGFTVTLHTQEVKQRAVATLQVCSKFKCQKNDCARLLRWNLECCRLFFIILHGIALALHLFNVIFSFESACLYLFSRSPTKSVSFFCKRKKNEVKFFLIVHAERNYQCHTQYMYFLFDTNK